MPRTADYDNEFEKQIFMAINICRVNPKHFAPIVRDTAATHQLAKAVPPATVKALIIHLQKCEALGYVSFDDQCNQACRKNNALIIEKEEEVPTKGGNIICYNEIVGSDKTTSCSEYTMCKYEGSSANEFVALELILDWAREGEAGKKSPILDKEVMRVGISNKSHKKVINLIQVLYLKKTVNVLE